MNKINDMEELQQYRAIGTVEETQKKMEELERWHTDRINENIKNPFAYTSTLICHNCDHKDEYIEELESEVAEYKTIGTIEEFQDLKEKNNEHYSDIDELDGYGYGCTNKTCNERIRAKAIDEFKDSIKTELDRFGVVNLDTCVLYDFIDRIAEQMKGRWRE